MMKTTSSNTDVERKQRHVQWGGEQWGGGVPTAGAKLVPWDRAGGEYLSFIRTFKIHILRKNRLSNHLMGQHESKK